MLSWYWEFIEFKAHQPLCHGKVGTESWLENFSILADTLLNNLYLLFATLVLINSLLVFVVVVAIVLYTFMCG